MKKRIIKKMIIFVAVMIVATCGSLILASAAGSASSGWIKGNLVVTRGSGVWPTSQIRGTTSTSHSTSNVDLRLEMWLVFHTDNGEQTTWSNVHSASNTNKLEKTLAASNRWGRRGNAEHYGTCYCSSCGMSSKKVTTNVVM